jgi:FkbM family methyltransferase
MWAKEYSKRFHRVYAFEPIRDNIRCVELNAPTATIIPCALTDRQGFIKFRVKAGNFAHVGEGEHEVFGTTIDSFEYPDLGLIKLDVEGQEVQTLNGARKTIEKHRPVIVVEVKFTPKEIRGWLTKNGYERKECGKIDEVWVSEI